jgi:hypothetical protein
MGIDRHAQLLDDLAAELASGSGDDDHDGTREQWKRECIVIGNKGRQPLLSLII